MRDGGDRRGQYGEKSKERGRGVTVVVRRGEGKV